MAAILRSPQLLRHALPIASINLLTCAIDLRTPRWGGGRLSAIWGTDAEGRLVCAWSVAAADPGAGSG